MGLITADLPTISRTPSVHELSFKDRVMTSLDPIAEKK